jgi:hypothetical protein
MAMLVGSNPKSLVLYLSEYTPERKKRPTRTLICFGPKRHYRKDGSCKHTDAVMDALKSEWHRTRTHIVPFGEAALGGEKEESE